MLKSLIFKEKTPITYALAFECLKTSENLWLTTYLSVNFVKLGGYGFFVPLATPSAIPPALLIVFPATHLQRSRWNHNLR